MNTGLSVTWQTFRLGPRVSTVGRAAYSTLHIASGASKQPLKPFSIRHGISQSPSCHMQPKRPLGSPPLNWPNFDGLRKQSRCVNFWRRPPEKEAQEEMTAEDELSMRPEEIEEVFGRKMDPDKGIEILMTLQKHRAEGTLDHQLEYSDALISKGLAYLRKVNPVDEDAAIIARVDRETSRVPQTIVEQSPHAVSQFDKLRQENKEKHNLQEAKREREEKQKLEDAARTNSRNVEVKGKEQTTASNNLVGLRPEPQWVRNYREKTTNNDEHKTSISVWGRLLPSAALAISVVVLSILFVQNYKPPSQNARILPNLPPAAATVVTIIGFNCLVFGLWRIPQLWTFMNRNFLVVPVHPYSIAMLGAPFSHQHFNHLLMNVVCLWLIGTHCTFPRTNGNEIVELIVSGST